MDDRVPRSGGVMIQKWFQDCRMAIRAGGQEKGAEDVGLVLVARDESPRGVQPLIHSPCRRWPGARLRPESCLDEADRRGDSQRLSPNEEWKAQTVANERRSISLSSDQS